MNADGTKAGYDLEMTAAVANEVDIPVVASGGAGTLEDILAVLTVGRAEAALAASIFHFGQYTIEQVKSYLHENGVPVRLMTSALSAAATEGANDGKTTDFLN